MDRKKPTRVHDNCPLHRSIYRLPFRRSKFPNSDSGTDNSGMKVTPTTASDSPSNSKTHFYLGKFITPHKTHPAEEVNIPIEPGSSVVKNTGRFKDKTVIPVQIQATKPQIPVSGFQSKPAAKNIAGNKNEPGNGSQHDHNHKYTAYIEHVKNQMRSKSDIGEEIITEGPIVTRTATKRDSFNDRITNFITRAKKNIKMTHPSE